MSSDYSAYYVHWSDLSEWNSVKKNILSDSMDSIIKGYETMLMWKLRNPNLPAYVECTCSLLEVMIQEYKTLTSLDQKETMTLMTDNNLRLSYSAALIRFVNHVSSVSTFKGDTLYLQARTQNIPDWIINMRHDVSHGQTLPQLDALHIAAKLCFKWLIDNYWANEESSMGELDSDFISSNLNDKHQIVPILKKSIALWYKLSLDNLRAPKKCFIDSTKTSVLAFKDLVALVKSNNYGKSAAAEPLHTISKAVEEAINYQKDKDEHVNRKKLIKITEVIEAIFGLIESISAKGNAKELLVSVLMESNFLIDSENGQQWEDIILSLQHLKAFSILLESLFRKAGEGSTDAVNWLITLGPSIKSLKQKWKIYKKLEKEAGPEANQKALKEKAIDLDANKYPDVKINLAMVKPPKVTLEMMRGILTNPDSMSLGLFHQYSKLIDPPLNHVTLNVFQNLINIYTCENDDDEIGFETSDKIFTIEDLNLNRDENVNAQDSKDETEEGVDEDEELSWRKSSIDSGIWIKSAIGLLPNQKSIDCNLPGNLKWKISSAQCKKRPSGFLLDYVVKMKKSNVSES